MEELLCWAVRIGASDLLRRSTALPLPSLGLGWRRERAALLRCGQLMAGAVPRCVTLANTAGVVPQNGTLLCVYAPSPCYRSRVFYRKRDFFFFLVAKVLIFMSERNLCESRCKNRLLLQDVLCASSCQEGKVLETGSVDEELLPAMCLPYSKRCVRLAGASSGWSTVGSGSSVCVRLSGLSSMFNPNTSQPRVSCKKWTFHQTTFQQCIGSEVTNRNSLYNPK